MNTRARTIKEAENAKLCLLKTANFQQRKMLLSTNGKNTTLSFVRHVAGAYRLHIWNKLAAEAPVKWKGKYISENDFISHSQINENKMPYFDEKQRKKLIHEELTVFNLHLKICKWVNFAFLKIGARVLLRSSYSNEHVLSRRAFSFFSTHLLNAFMLT